MPKDYLLMIKSYTLKNCCLSLFGCITLAILLVHSFAICVVLFNLTSSLSISRRGGYCLPGAGRTRGEVTCSGHPAHSEAGPGSELYWAEGPVCCEFIDLCSFLPHSALFNILKS